MAIIDKELMFSNEQSLSEAAASSNVVDQGAAGDAYVPLWLTVNVAADVTGTLGFELQTCAAANFSANVVTLMEVAAASRTGTGSIYKGRLPKGCLRYIRLNYKGTVSAGKVTAYLSRDESIQ